MSYSFKMKLNSLNTHHHSIYHRMHISAKQQAIPQFIPKRFRIMAYLS